MDEKKDGKKKESIDEILADLNGLLNKMPAMLEGIKLPEIKPVDLSGVWKEEPAEPKAPAADLTSRAEPRVYSVEPAGLESAPQMPEIKPAPEEPDPAAAPVAPEDEKTPAPAEVRREPHIYDPESLKAEEAAIENAFGLEPEKKEESAAGFQAGRFEGTMGFGVPDIDTLIKLSQDEAIPDKAGVEGGGGGGDAVEPAAAPEEKAAPEHVETAAPASEAAPGPNFENLVIEPAAVAGEEVEVMDLKKEESRDDETMKPAQDAAGSGFSERSAPSKPEELVLEVPGAAVADAAAAGVDAEPPVAAPQEEIPAPRELTLKASDPAPAAPGLVIERADAVFGAADSQAAAEEDKTTVIPPPAGRGEQDKTVIYEAGADLGATSRSRESLESLAAKEAPEGMPPERVRNVAFLYASEDAGLCAEVLAELDAICSKSASKPMFVKRAFVQVCEPGVGGNVVMQKVADAAAVGLVCLGNVPQENVFEIENVFTAGGVFFRHLPREGFNHSSALDLVTEFILR